MSQPVPRAARRWIMICLAVLGGVVLFCAGILLGRQQADPQRPRNQSGTTARASLEHPFRNVFSPSVLADPHVLDEQRKVVEALESACAHQRQNCATARNARAYLDANK